MSSSIWHIIRTAPQMEFYVNDLLSDNGFAVYTPFEKLPRNANGYTKKSGRRRRYVTKPLLRGYVFVEIPKHDTQAYFALIRVLYDLNLIRGLFGPSGSRSYTVFGKQMETLRDVYKRGYDRHKDGDRVEATGPDGMMLNGTFEVGDVVRYIDGGLSEIEVPVVTIEDSQAKFLMIIFGHERLVTAPISELMLVRKKTKAA